MMGLATSREAVHLVDQAVVEKGESHNRLVIFEI